MNTKITLIFKALVLCGMLCFISCGEETSKTAYIDAVKADDFKEAHAILDNIYMDYLEAISDDSGVEKKANAYWDAAMYIYKAEMMYLFPMNDETANQRLIATVETINIPGKKPIEGEMYKKEDKEDLSKFDAYVYFVERYNRLCDEMLDIAIMHGNEEVAKKMIKLYEDDYMLRKDDEGDSYHDWIVGNHHYITTYFYVRSTKSLDDAKKRLKEAQEEGAFN